MRTTPLAQPIKMWSCPADTHVAFVVCRNKGRELRFIHNTISSSYENFHCINFTKTLLCNPPLIQWNLQSFLFNLNSTSSNKLTSLQDISDHVKVFHSSTHFYVTLSKSLQKTTVHNEIVHFIPTHRTGYSISPLFDSEGATCLFQQIFILVYQILLKCFKNKSKS